ncbi:MAG: S-layer homology domain-containing protein [Clostridia bacterium]|nr:S-layer homology domain-containing protein [Clostridia bacterium]
MPEWENPFCDVTDDDWYCDDVKYVSMNGLISGMTQSTFAPDGLLTRGMLVAVLYRVEGEPFADVDENVYYAKAVGWAK